MRTPVIVSWSGGKDSALLVQHLLREPKHQAVGLVTAVTAEYDRISMHGIRRSILDAQVARLGLPLQEATIPQIASNAAYEEAFIAALARARVAYPGVRTVAFGDLYLEDVRSYREQFLVSHGWQPLFPLWGLNTASLARQFVEDGFQAIVCCVDSTQLAPDFAGRDFDTAFLDTLPPSVDPCGERGEFHTYVYGGPIFDRALVLERGGRVLRDGRFEFCDLRLRTFGTMSWPEEKSPLPKGARPCA